MGPQANSGAKSIFRLCLFLDIWSMVRGLEYEILGALVMLVKIDGTLFFRSKRSKAIFRLPLLKIGKSNIIYP